MRLKTMVMGSNLHWQGTWAKKVYTGGGSGMQMYSRKYTRGAILTNTFKMAVWGKQKSAHEDKRIGILLMSPFLYCAN